ncbi:hypothetical protein GVN16_03345 [Emticicia sp. CRIBPO]|uniref:hypothetical protein n=1 Tax=Emticicia sp. CRIBPO TaxID=2683258 RepID=UPI001412DC26|nr:hypothetical protein [Emticicia sp. CRIBPO]NBA84775.1 hypothetical protein [Emticicia sp. CRIBPO]
MKDKYQALYFKVFNRKRIRVCLYPNCKKKAIKSHSVSNKRGLDLISFKRHVMTLNLKHNITSRDVYFEKKGVFESSIFLGFCDDHDREIFDQIDNFAFDLSNNEQLFLFAYRAFMKSYYFHYDNLETDSELLISNKILGLEKFDPLGPDLLEYTRSYYSFMYRYELKSEFDNLLVNKDFSALEYSAVEINHDSPTIALSDFFSLNCEDPIFKNSFLVFNILPVSKKKSIALFSYKKEDSVYIKEFLADILDENDSIIKNISLSKLILENCDNFFLNPVFYSNWGYSKQKLVLDYIVSCSNNGGALFSNEFILFK